MDDKLQKKIREAEEAHAEEVLTEHLAENRQVVRDRALLLLGGFKAAQKIAHAINSEVMRAIETFQADRLYQAFGFDRFVDFLDGYEHSPMSKNQYYERKALLDKEGDVLFDMYGSLGLSVRRRKLLGRGNVEISGDTAIIHDGEESTEISLSDRSRLLETLSALADANADKSVKLDRQQQKIDKHDSEKRELYSEIDRVKAAASAAVASDPHTLALVRLQLAYRDLCEVAVSLNDAEKQQLKFVVFEKVADCNQDLAGAYGSTDWTKLAPNVAEGSASTGDDEMDYCNSILDRVDLDAVENNDGELAARL